MISTQLSTRASTMIMTMISSIWSKKSAMRVIMPRTIMNFMTTATSWPTTAPHAAIQVAPLQLLRAVILTTSTTFCAFTALTL